MHIPAAITDHDARLRASDFITVLQSSGSLLTKLITAGEAGVNVIAPEPGSKFNGAHLPVSSLDDLKSVLIDLAPYPSRCVVRGALAAGSPAKGIKRRSVTAAEAATLLSVPHQWLPIDVDGAPLPAGTAPQDLHLCAEMALNSLPTEFHRARCLVQATSGHGIKPGARLRFWFWLSRSITDVEAKAWLRGFAVDSSIYRPEILIYVADPVFKGNVTEHLPCRLIDMDGEVCVSVPAEIYVEGKTERLTFGAAEAPIEDIRSALEAMPNDTDWDGFNNVGMATWRASGGSQEGLDAFVAWSAKSSKHDLAECEARWDHYFQSPPDQIGFGTLAYHARQADPSWSIPSRPRVAAEDDFEAEDRPVGYISRRVIQIRADNLSEQISEAELALLEADSCVFQRDGRVVRVGSIAEKDWHGVEMQAQRIVIVDETRLMDILSMAADWLTPPKGRRTSPARARCPAIVAKAYLARKGDGWRLPVLRGIVNTPTMRADGTLLISAGYDRQSGLLLDPTVEYPAIPDNPSRQEAIESLSRLKNLLREFPFVDEDSRVKERGEGGGAVSLSVALSAILTAIIRPSLPCAPMHAITAPTPGSGKTCLVDLVSTLTTGHAASAISVGQNDEELEKRLVAELLIGRSTIVLDNISRQIGGDLLNQCITQERVTVRRLGKSESIETACTAVILANGNNLRIASDMTRRVLLCGLDAEVERPELRVFSQNPLGMMRKARGQYVADVLTVLRAYHTAGYPDCPPPLNGFDAWSRRVRGPLLWLGEADPVTSMDSVRANDPARQLRAAIMGQWEICIGSQRVTVAEAISIAKAPDNGEFKTALLLVAEDGRGEVSTKRLGTWLGATKGARVGPRYFESGPQRNGSGTWILRGIEADDLPPQIIDMDDARRRRSGIAAGRTIQSSPQDGLP